MKIVFQKQNKRLKAYVFLSISTIIFASSLIISKIALLEISAFDFLFLRYSIVATFAIPIITYYLIKNRLNFWLIVKTSAIEFIGIGLAHILLYSGLSETGAIEASIITTTTPIFITLGGIYFLKEKEEGHEWLGLAISFIATILLVCLPLLKNTEIGLINSTGNFLVLLAVISSSTHAILMKKNYHKVPKMLVSSIGSMGALVIISFINFFIYDQSFSFIKINFDNYFSIPSVFLAVTFMSIFATMIAFPSYIKGQSLIEASEASLFSYLQPIIYIPLGILLLNENVASWHFYLLLVILFGVIVAEKRFDKKNKFFSFFRKKRKYHQLRK